MSGHGTRSRYNQGCRCKACHAANNAYRRDYYALRKCGVRSLQSALLTVDLVNQPLPYKL